MSKRFKLTAIDVDGTLQNSWHEITPRTETALRTAIAQGVHVVLATGKQYIGIEPIVARLGLGSPQITSGGAVITHAGKAVYEERVPRHLAQQVIEQANQMGVTMILLRDNATFATAINQDIEYMLSYGDPYPTVVKNLMDALNPLPTQMYIIPYHQDETYENAVREFSARFGDKLGVRKSSPYYLEFVHKAVSKGMALKKVGEIVGVEPEAMLAIGDSYNDLSMFEVAGYAVAMGQSKPDIQEAADEVTASNDADGVGLAIEKLVLG